MKCIYCGAETENIIDDEYVCLNCMNTLYMPCANCGELHDKEKMTCTDIGYVCSECLERDFTCCSDCGVWVHNDDICMVDGDWHCSECLEYYFTCCSDCGVWVHNDNTRTVRINRAGYEADVCAQCCDDSYSYCTACGAYVRNEEGTDRTYDGEWRCYECLNNSDYFIYCESCDTYYIESDMSFSESRQEWFCPNCYEEDEEDEEDDKVIQSYHSGHKGGLQFFEWPHERAQNQQLYYGIELEVENIMNRYDIETIAKETLQVLDTELWHCEHDGSLTDGCEFISQPITFAYLHSPRVERKIKSALALLSSKGARSYDTSHCGLHFHVSRAGLTPQAIVNLLVMTTRFKEVIFKLSRRTQTNFQQWSRTYDEITELTPAIKSDIKDDTIPYCNFDRYCMINLTNRATVEFRFFRGTLNPDSFYGSLNFIAFLVSYSLKCETESDITSSMKDFILEAKNYSNVLKNFMEKVGL